MTNQINSSISLTGQEHFLYTWYINLKFPAGLVTLPFLKVFGELSLKCSLWLVISKVKLTYKFECQKILLTNSK